MIYFVQPQYLLLLFLIPIFFIIFGISMMLRRRRIRKMGDEALVKQLMPSASVAKGWVRITFFSLAFLFFTIGIARPQTGAVLKEKKSKGVEIMIALDVSNSMLAQDYSPNRLERAKLAITKLVDKLRDDRFGMVVFAGSAYVQIPITTDYVSAKMFLRSISTDSAPVQGTAIGEAISTAFRSFSTQSENSRAIIVITDGENHEDDAVEAAAQVAECGARVFTIGVGSPDGKPIPTPDGLMKDKNGEVVMTRLNEEALMAIAQAGKGAYIRAGRNEFGLGPIVEQIQKMDQEEFNSMVFEEYEELYMYFFAFALVLLLIEMLIGERRHKFHLFK